MLSKILLIIFLLTLISLVKPRPAQAKIELTFSQPPSSIVLDQPISLSVTLSGASAEAQYYLRGAFFKQDTTSYYGETKNQSGNWNSTGHDQYFLIQGNQTVDIEFRLPSTHPLQVGDQIIFKIGRYTTGGSLTWSEQVTEPILITTAVTPTPTEEAGVGGTVATPTPSPTPSSTPDQQTITKAQSGQIVLSEIFACQTDQQPEWVELKNTTNQDLHIENWKLIDSAQHLLKELNFEISANQLYVVELTSSQLNNSGDSVTLKNSDSNIDAMSYVSCQNSSSLIRNNNTWEQTTTITKGQPNIYTALVQPTTTPTRTPSPTPLPKLNSGNDPDEETSEGKTIVATSHQPQPTPAGLLLPELTNLEASSEAVGQLSEVLGVKDESSSSSRNWPILLIFSGIFLWITAAGLAQQWYNQLDDQFKLWPLPRIEKA